MRMRSCGELAGRSNRREPYRFHCQNMDFELPPLSSCVCVCVCVCVLLLSTEEHRDFSLIILSSLVAD